MKKVFGVLGVLFFAVAAHAGNEFEEILKVEMPKIELAFGELQKQIEIDKNREETLIEELKKFPMVEVQPGMFAPSFFASPDLYAQINRFKQLGDELNSLRKKLKSPNWDFMLQNAVPLIKEYSWAIPNDEAIQVISKYSPIIEIGAGSGYWMKLLIDNQADVIGYDNGEANYFKKRWADVQKGSEVFASRYPDRALLLIWPPRWNEMAFNALEYYTGDHVIYVGEMGSESATGTEDFFKKLNEDFELITTVGLQNWPSYTDKVHVFKRRHPVDRENAWWCNLL